MCAYTEGSIRIQRGVYPIQPFELELIQSHMAQKPMLRGEVLPVCASVVRSILNFTFIKKLFELYFLYRRYLNFF